MRFRKEGGGREKERERAVLKTRTELRPKSVQKRPKSVMLA